MEFRQEQLLRRAVTLPNEIWERGRCMHDKLKCCYGDGQGFGLGFHGREEKFWVEGETFSRRSPSRSSGLTCYPRVGFQRNMLYSASERRGDEARPI